MDRLGSLIGTWVSLLKDPRSSDDRPDCIWHVIDEKTCVYEQATEMGLMISWFQYWPHVDGIRRYPLSKTARSMFKTGAGFVPLELEAAHLTMNGYRFVRSRGLPVPQRFDVFPGTRPDESGSRVPFCFRGKLLDHLTEPPKDDVSNVSADA